MLSWWVEAEVPLGSEGLFLPCAESFRPSPDLHFYDESKPFTCLDSSATIPFDQVNDDYCDCKDGSDEPGEFCLPSFVYHASMEHLLNAWPCVVTKIEPVPLPVEWEKLAQKRVVSGLVRGATGAVGAQKGPYPAWGGEVLAAS